MFKGLNNIRQISEHERKPLLSLPDFTLGKGKREIIES